jgi:hypothetical protein
MMRLTVGFTDDAPQHEVTGRAKAILTDRYAPSKEQPDLTGHLVHGAAVVDAFQKAGAAAVVTPDLAEFLQHIRGEDESLMVQLRWH